MKYVQITPISKTQFHGYDLIYNFLFLFLPGGSDGKESAYNAGGPKFDPWVEKIPCRRK